MPSALRVYLADTLPDAGEVVVSELNDTGAKGTFRFKASILPGGSSVDLTGGTFDVKFTQQ